ncbi:MAG: hypothetical protein A2381_08300 [Bdellovibrionales bacterium RIFOXYB1_FULL_37_110]|nr:MAG: hypothetical protein A2417_12160 [Bdellovibrionales bacterium RIFOXYC1_FULL_37_79]OFZ60081.1 MAG: hypothetical protein A2381_08300 [Bdellovibrionales bacterium RIFOXYB1_FULL_37_110]OFZ64923.1 MAG: hypothetical protein A2577_02080 [Bdellovibrionales bacterium RIFOXYD1_FULL_36_51]OFZ67238.1 MAG: hypothetical protein A2328_11700 [Bdellovibrionales bacterium RIFOXYB2_FULL_36_6]
MKNIFILICLTLLISGCSSWFKTKKENVTPPDNRSSEIPLKREFPINDKINPCENFYEYACSKVIDSFKLREDRSIHIFSFDDAEERLLDYKKKYFVNLANIKPKSQMEKEIKTVYLACMNEEASKKEEVEIVKQTISQMNSITTREQFINMVARNITEPLTSFVQFDAGLPNQDNPLKKDLLFDNSLRSLPEKTYYEKEELIKDLLVLIEDFFKTIELPDPSERAKMVYEFEKDLAKIFPTPPEIQKLVSSRTSISREELIKDYPYLKLEGFLKKIPKNTHIRNIIGVEVMKFLDDKLKTASLEELKNVFLYFQLKQYMDDAYPDFFQKSFDFRKKYLGGPNVRPERQERCTKLVMNSFTKELDYILMPKLFPNFPKKKFVNSIEKLRKTLIDQLKENSWLTSEAKKEAIRKITKIKLQLVSPDNNEEWDFNPRTSYWNDRPNGNVKKLTKLIMDKNLKELRENVSPDRWEMGPLTINAYYNPAYNKIVFPVGILQYPFYDVNESEEVNMAAIGAIIAHEIGHSIDDNGNKYNADGLLKSWMNDADKKTFDQKSAYLVTQFDKIGHNGKFTLGENIGDLVGASLAYRTAFGDDKNKSKELKQKFFLQFARLWCEIQKPEIAELRLKIDPHSLGYARTNEQIKHQAGFKEAYSCKDTDPMVIPEADIVKIW